VNTSPEIQLSAGTIKYEDAGGPGPVILFVTGCSRAGCCGRPWCPLLSGEARCIVPELPLGAHEQPMNPDAELSPRSVAGLLAEFMDKLDLNDVTLVGNDTGGAICQLLVTEHPERVGRLVLTPCDAFEQFFSAGLPGAPVGVEGAGRAELRAAAGQDPRRAQQPALVRLAVQARHPG